MGALDIWSGDLNWILSAGTKDDNLVDENPTNSFSEFQRTP